MAKKPLPKRWTKERQQQAPKTYASLCQSRRKKELARHRRYYQDHRLQQQERARFHRRERGTEVVRQDRYGTYSRARCSLWRICRPDKAQRYSLQATHPGIDGKSCLFDSKTAANLDIIYRKRLKSLRLLFGRDHETGCLPHRFKLSVPLNEVVRLLEQSTREVVEPNG